MSQYSADQFDRCDLLTIAGDVDCDVRSVVGYLSRDKTTLRSLAKAIDGSIKRLRDEGRIKPRAASEAAGGAARVSGVSGGSVSKKAG